MNNINRKVTSIILVVFFLVLFSNSGYSQVVIKMKKQGGVSVIPCKVNGLNLSFIFDTGASDVTISLTEALFMLKNGYLEENDITGEKKFYSDANGDLSEGEVIVLREIDIQGLKLYNVKASIVKELNAPLLLGQSAISKLGVVQLDLVANTLTILTNQNKPKVSNPISTAEKKLECVDFEGNAYKVVRIGDQIWMAENLKTTHYSNGDEIFQIHDKNIWNSINIGAWCYFNNDPNIGKEYSRLYNWYAVADIRKICPNGWRIPTKSDFELLINNLGGEFSSAFMLMESGDRFWKTGLGNNRSGFSARGGGWRGGDGLFYYWIRDTGNWWTTTKERPKTSWDKNHPWFLMINGSKSIISRDPYFSVNAGVSVRCIKE